MLKRKRFIISILLIVCLYSLIGCDISKNVNNKEVKEFTKSILESDDKIKELKFYFRRPSLWAELVYDGELDKEDVQLITDEFKTLINVKFMQKIGDEYWGGSRPSEFNLYIYVDEKKDETDYDYQITSKYNKTHISDEDPENIDGYETWTISDKKDTIDVGTVEDSGRYYFEPNVSIIEGTLITRMYYGPPNYGENPDTDAKQYPFILQLDDPIDVIAQEGDTHNSNIFEVIEIQVVPMNKEQTELLEQYINKSITIQGTLFEAIFGGHHTDTLIRVEKILD